jgi:hypothetical protein
VEQSPLEQRLTFQVQGSPGIFILYSDSRHLIQVTISQHRVVAVSGPNGRKLFFNNPSLNMQEGYKIFLTGVPDIDDVQPAEASENTASSFLKRVHFVLQKDRIVEGEINHHEFLFAHPSVVQSCQFFLMMSIALC